MPSLWVRGLLLSAALAGPACAVVRDAQAPRIVQPGAPGQPGRVVSAARAADLSSVAASAADVSFMQGMIGHHAQAVEMVGLLRTRTTREEMRKLALRIELSQQDEMAMMRRWLEVRGRAVADVHAHHAPGAPAGSTAAEHGAMMMPGMLSADEMARLGQATGAEFDRLFLEGMITHHEGAIAMVRQLFDTPGAGQEAEIFAFASDVDADQRMEIDRMRAMLVTRFSP